MTQLISALGLQPYISGSDGLFNDVSYRTNENEETSFMYNSAYSYVNIGS